MQFSNAKDYILAACMYLWYDSCMVRIDVMPGSANMMRTNWNTGWTPEPVEFCLEKIWKHSNAHVLPREKLQMILSQVSTWTLVLLRALARVSCHKKEILPWMWLNLIDIQIFTKKDASIVNILMAMHAFYLFPLRPNRSWACTWRTLWRASLAWPVSLTRSNHWRRKMPPASCPLFAEHGAKQCHGVIFP